jgi:erythronate-4-phosphate dehydrogenase
MRLLVDDNVAHAADAFAPFGDVVTMPGADITSEALDGFDALIIRSTTAVNADLLKGSSIKFVGTATSGDDHVDTNWLRANGIAFANAHGSNAESVGEWALASLLEACDRKGKDDIGALAIGIVGVGAVGRPLADRFAGLTCRLRLCDPPRAREEDSMGDFLPLSDALATSDVVSLHVPLKMSEPYATYHMIARGALVRMRSGSWMMNSSRGAVVDNEALLECLQEKQIDACIMDVWEDEPTPDPELVKAVTLGTPHIAGHSYDGKVMGTQMIVDALAAFTGVTPTWNAEDVLREGTDDLWLTVPEGAEKMKRTRFMLSLVRQMYDVRKDEGELLAIADLKTERARGDRFQRYRGDYPKRRSWSRYKIKESDIPEDYRKEVAAALLVQVIPDEEGE